MAELRTIARDLRFPEGPVALPDGSVLLVEIARGALSRVAPDGSVEVVADIGGGPNGVALGPDGTAYVVDNGGYFSWIEGGGAIIPGPTPDSYRGGALHRVDLASGAITTLATACDGKGLVAPNDIVVDADGGLWFTDHGVQRGEHADRPGLLWASPDGSEVRGVAWGIDAANGVGLSPAGDRVYVAETHHGRVLAWDVTGPGAVAGGGSPTEPHAGEVLHDADEGVLFDSLAVDGEGWVCVATIGPGGITAVRPDGGAVEHVPADDGLTTNICFGGDDLRTAYLTLSSSGRLAAVEWPRPGLRLANQG